MKTRIIIISALLLLQYSGYAGKASDSLKVTEATSDFISKKISERSKGSKGSSPELKNVYSSEAGRLNKIYGFNVVSGGYVFGMEHDDDVIIIAYSTSGSIGKTINPEMMAFLSAYESTPVEKINYKNIDSESKGSVSPLLDVEGIQWDQDTYYNSLCPYDADDAARTLVGCVGVAVGQIMRYHKFPSKGKGSHSYIHSKYGLLSADFGNTIYDWANMPGSLINENNEIAKLLYHIGVAVDMNYGVTGSSAKTEAVTDALSDYFGYNDAQLIDNDNFTALTNELEEILRSEIDNNRPFFYELQGEPTHTVVVDGYDGDLFHINFGWGGLDNGYFSLAGTSLAGGYTFGFRGNSILGISPAKIPVNVQDSLALVSFYNSTNGSAWNDNSNWLTGRLKTWKGVDIVNGRVIHLHLDNNNLTGTLTGEIGKLTMLKGLNLSSNKITGILPPELGLLTELYDLSLSFNEINGSIAGELGNLTNLRALYLSYNKLEGSIPSTFGQLGFLKILSLSNNLLTGSIPVELCNLVSLNTLDLAKNQLSGSIPSPIGNLVNLTDFLVSFNNLSGELPSSVSSLTEIQFLEVEDNDFSGSIPPGIGDMTLLTNLKIDNNHFTLIPAEIGKLTSLERLTAVNNQIGGSLTAGIGQLTSLKHLDLSNNLITGLPEEIGNLQNLEYLSLTGNRIKELPPTIGKLALLSELYLGSNEITDIPYEINSLNKLLVLTLDHNRIQSVNFGLALLKKLSSVDLSYNLLDKPLPPLSHLASLEIDHNKLIFSDISSSGFINPELLRCFYTYQDVVTLMNNEIIFVPGDPLNIDIRNISRFSHPANIYSWYKEGMKLYDGPVLSFNPANDAIEGNYYCVVNNPYYSSLTIFSDTLKLIPDSKISDDDLITSAPGSILNVSDSEVKIVKPSGLRGQFTWQASLDSVSWLDLGPGETSSFISENVKSITSDSLIITPVKKAVYRYRLIEDECDPVYSDTILISPFRSLLLLDTVLNVTTSASFINLKDIQINIPTGLSASDFRLTVEKIETPPSVPDSMIAGPVFDVKLSCGTTFLKPILIKIKVRSNTFDALAKDRFIPIYHDDLNYEWISYENYGISYTDTTIVFETDHLTKLSYWEKSWFDDDYTDKFSSGKVTVYYKAKHADLTGLYDKNQVDQEWHVPLGDPEFGTPLQIQDMAQFANEVLSTFDSLGLQVPESIAIYADQIDDYGVVGLMGMTNGYLTINILIDDPDLLRSVIAHEYMHYTQDYYILAQPGNVFWMEANGHTADRMVWDENTLPVSESDKYLMENRTGENNIFQFLARSWDYWDASILTHNVTGNLDFCYMAGTFIHYMRSYKSGTTLKPEVLLKETAYTGTWRDYLDNYIKSNLNSNINDQYEDFIKLIMSGSQPNFTLLNRIEDPGSDPFKYFNQTPEEFARKHLIRLPEDQVIIPVEEKTLSMEVEPLSARMEQFYNMSLNRSLCVSYARQHSDTAGLHVYLCKYNPATKTMDMTDISRVDSSHFFILAASDLNVSEKSNQVFLLYINKSGDRKITAEYDLKITPVTDFNQLFTLWFEGAGGFEAYIHNYTDGQKRRILFWEQAGASRYKEYTDSSFTITETRQEGTMTVYYNFRNGNMTITEDVAGTYGYFEDPETYTASFSGTKTIKLKNIFFASLSEQYVLQGAGIYEFHSTGTANTQGLIDEISETYHSECTDCGVPKVLESYTYTNTDWSAWEGIKLHIQVK